MLGDTVGVGGDSDSGGAVVWCVLTAGDVSDMCGTDPGGASTSGVYLATGGSVHSGCAVWLALDTMGCADVGDRCPDVMVGAGVLRGDVAAGGCGSGC
jgi:hypothetical protein